jgi:ABC-2 type transport system ATP-binding protein
VDPQSRERIYMMLECLSAEGTALLLTTHHLDEAESQCGRIVIIDGGQVVASGTLTELIQQTVGTGRQVRLQVENEYVKDVPGWTWDPRGRRFDACVEDVADQLPQLLHRMSTAGYSVTDVEVHAPRLHQVFLHLTGRALRE